MKNFLTEIQKDYPGTRMEKYGDHYEIFLKKDITKGGWKISGTQDQVKNIVGIIINLENNAHKLKS